MFAPHIYFENVFGILTSNVPNASSLFYCTEITNKT